MSDHLSKAGAWALIAFAILSTVCAEEFNGTTYRLGTAQVEVIQPVNTNRLNLTLQAKAENITLLDENGKLVGINSSYLFWRGNNIYRITFDRHVSGRLVYAMPQQGQQFILPLEDSGPVRIVLPPGYTTGDRILGIARPAPDEFHENSAGDVLTWWNTSQIGFLEVSYYRDNALPALMKIFAVLAAAGVALLAEYYFSIRRLRAIREDAEKRA